MTPLLSVAISMLFAKGTVTSAALYVSFVIPSCAFPIVHIVCTCHSVRSDCNACTVS